MALNPSTNATMAGRITAADGDYPYGSSKDETAPAAGDGTPYFKARADDIFGFQQALLALASIVPSGNAETVNDSEYTKAITELAAGRATAYDEDGTSAADAYVVALQANQQGANALFGGMTVTFTTAFTNTGAATVDVSEAIGQAVGTTVKNVKLPDGSDPGAGAINGRTVLTYNLSADRMELILGARDVASTSEAQAGTDNAKVVTPLRLHEAMLGGVAQSLTDVTGSRANNVIYTNTTGRPIWVSVIPEGNFSQSLWVDNLEVGRQPAIAGSDIGMTAIVPNGSTYELRGTVSSIGSWVELR